MARVYKETNRSFPRVSDDDVIDYMVLEAVVVKLGEEQKEMDKKAEIEDWKGDLSSLRESIGK